MSLPNQVNKLFQEFMDTQVNKLINEHIHNYILAINEEFGISKRTLSELWNKISGCDDVFSDSSSSHSPSSSRAPSPPKDKDKPKICKHIFVRKNNERCEQKAKEGSDYCYKHKKPETEKGKEKEKEKEEVEDEVQEMNIRKHKQSGYFVDVNTRLIVKSKDDLTVIGKQLVNNTVRPLKDEDVRLCKKMMLKYEKLETIPANNDGSFEKKDSIEKMNTISIISKKEEPKKEEPKKEEKKEEPKKELKKEKKEEPKKEEKEEPKKEEKKEEPKKEVPKGKGMIKGKIEKSKEETQKESISKNAVSLKEMVLTTAPKQEELVSETMQSLKNKSISQVIKEICEDSESDDEMLDDE